MKVPIDVFTTFLNNGMQVRRGVPLHVQIREAGGRLVCDRDTVVESLGAGESVEMHFGRSI